MKLLLLTLALFTCTIGLSKNAVAANKAATNMAADSVRKKIVHPKEAMTDAEANGILNAMRQQKNDQEKAAVLKEMLKGKGIHIEQLIKLLNQFLTDDAKLESAEYAFQYTTNYKAFLRIMDLFSQEGYKYKLEDYYDKNRK